MHIWGREGPTEIACNAAKSQVEKVLPRCPQVFTPFWEIPPKFPQNQGPRKMKCTTLKGLPLT